MNTLLSSLQGRKTYLAAAMGCLYVLGALAGLWAWDERIVALFFAGGLAFLRAGVSKGPVLVLAGALLASGCSTPQRTAYVTTGAVAVTVDAAMNGWGDYVRAGKATAADEEAVKSAYEKYQAAMRTARAITHSYLDSGAVDSAPLIEAIRALDGAKTELLALINLFAHPL